MPAVRCEVTHYASRRVSFREPAQTSSTPLSGSACCSSFRACCRSFLALNMSSLERTRRASAQGAETDCHQDSGNPVFSPSSRRNGGPPSGPGLQQSRGTGPCSAAASLSPSAAVSMSSSSCIRTHSGGIQPCHRGMAQLHHPFRAGQITQRVSPQIGQPGIGREPVDHHDLGSGRDHGLAAMRQIPQPRGPVDGRAGLVGLIAQLHLAGMDPDAQPDRRQRR
jgi:hypothetical protein